jgi:hypothetical protein
LWLRPEHQLETRGILAGLTIEADGHGSVRLALRIGSGILVFYGGLKAALIRKALSKSVSRRGCPRQLLFAREECQSLPHLGNGRQ